MKNPTSSTVTVQWQEYPMFPYEREMAIRELRTLVRPWDLVVQDSGITFRTGAPASTLYPQLRKLTYFSSTSTGSNAVPTLQASLEQHCSSGRSHRRQSTRYSVHGLHEYKGKFNPQVARVLLNCLSLAPRALVLDPFCGSGTTLIECAHMNMRGVGCDLNPLAVYIAKAKLLSLGTSPKRIYQVADRILVVCRKLIGREHGPSDERSDYLWRWFTPDLFSRIEALREAILQEGGEVCSILNVLASNLLRDYSLQEPEDLRVRRRKSPLPKREFLEEFRVACDAFAAQLAAVQKILSRRMPECQVFNISSEKLGGMPELARLEGRIEGAITSPPYATALPYIDTQRLSLVWLSLMSPGELARTQAGLIGSREFMCGDGAQWKGRLGKNSDNLSAELAGFCQELQCAVNGNDGFRRQAVPALLYRYLVGMRSVFRQVQQLLKPRAPFALIIGSNHTTLGGKKHEINTPDLLASLAQQAKLRVAERVPLQTYQRYGIHHRNSVSREELLVLERE